MVLNNFLTLLKSNNLIKDIYNIRFIIVKILQIKKKFIIVDGNLKLEVYVNIKEFLDENITDIKEGDYIEVFLKNIENSFSKITLSRFWFKKYVFWKNMFLFNKKNFYQGTIINKIRGGYFISIYGFKCFLPFSYSDKKMLNVSYYFDRSLYFSILNFDFFRRNIVLSRKVVIKKILNIKKKIFFNNAKIGDIVKGIVKTITKYCVIVDIGYIDCVIFFKNLIWGNYRYLSSFFKIGQSIISIILKIDTYKNRVFLGVKQLFNFWNEYLRFKNCYKYVRIIKITKSNIYVSMGRNCIAYTTNWLNRKIFKLFGINKYKKVVIKRFDFKRKRIFLKFMPPLAQ